MPFWNAPKLTWDSQDAPSTADFERIENNAQFLKETLDNVKYAIASKAASDAPSTWPNGLSFCIASSGYSRYGIVMTLKASDFAAQVLLGRIPGGYGMPEISTLSVRTKSSGGDSWNAWEAVAVQ